MCCDERGKAAGRGRRNRTLGTRFWRPLLYLLSYAPMPIVSFAKTSALKAPRHYTQFALRCQHPDVHFFAFAKKNLTRYNTDKLVCHPERNMPQADTIMSLTTCMKNFTCEKILPREIRRTSLKVRRISLPPSDCYPVRTRNGTVHFKCCRRISLSSSFRISFYGEDKA